MQKTQFLIGIDEAGRGPLAGPVAVGAVRIPIDFDEKLLVGIRDSKQLTEGERDAWYEKLEVWEKTGKLFFAVGLASHRVIDEQGISQAIRAAIKNALRDIEADPDLCEVLLDGGLRAPKSYLRQVTIIKGDEKVPIISLASIAAKVTRDRMMQKFAKKYPNYGFDVHKGYGTEKHREAIEAFGLCDIHRRTFCHIPLSSAPIPSTE